MKQHILIPLAIWLVVEITACQSITPQQAATITTTEKTIALAAQVAAPFVGNQKLANDLSAVAFVANSYGSQPVPTNIVQATAGVPALAGVVLPLVTGKNNSPKTVAAINGAALILAQAGTVYNPATNQP